MKKPMSGALVLLLLIPSLALSMGKDPKKSQKAPAPFDPISRSRTAKTVELYVTSWCGYCVKLENFMKNQGIPYTKYDIERDERAAEVFHSLGGVGVPVTRIGNQIVYGFDPDRILELL
jgi:glutaredoxin